MITIDYAFLFILKSEKSFSKMIKNTE